MIYSEEQIEQFTDEYCKVLGGLNSLMVESVRHSQEPNSPRLQEYMQQGVCRRLKVLSQAVINIFKLFPLETTNNLSNDALADTQINLHAFVINLYGFFENLAWAFAIKHNLELVIGNKNRISMFHNDTKKYLPIQLKEYLNSTEMNSWVTNYLKQYRDSLAHRIPLYIPPAMLTQEDKERYQALETEKFECIVALDFTRLDAINAEQQRIGTPCNSFLHAFSSTLESRPVYIHPQILCDCKGIIEFGNLFFECWHEHL